jgi:hypothetical protein
LEAGQEKITALTPNQTDFLIAAEVLFSPPFHHAGDVAHRLSVDIEKDIGGKKIRRSFLVKRGDQSLS